jgi:hypothetical protein
MPYQLIYFQCQKKLMVTSDKMNYRKAFDDLEYLNQINPNYKMFCNLWTKLNLKVLIMFRFTKNETNMIIPQRLQNDLLDF